MHTEVDQFVIDQVLENHLGARISGTRVDVMVRNLASLRSNEDFPDLASARVGSASLLSRVADNDDFLAEAQTLKLLNDDRFKRLKLSMRNYPS